MPYTIVPLSEREVEGIDDDPVVVLITRLQLDDGHYLWNDYSQVYVPNCDVINNNGKETKSSAKKSRQQYCREYVHYEKESNAPLMLLTIRE